ncbi:hypothetical protein QFZ77_004555 [Paenibacillus sp. V4I3]|nr:hypothetical protein [Paenibacillus sp. V4I3]MDQ0888041.1 hypothetical protein [Paenibacillus sp. V4I9]
MIGPNLEPVQDLLLLISETSSSVEFRYEESAKHEFTMEGLLCSEENRDCLPNSCLLR